MSSLRKRECERRPHPLLLASARQKHLGSYIAVNAYSWNHCCPLLKAVHDQIQRYLAGLCSIIRSSCQSLPAPSWLIALWLAGNQHIGREDYSSYKTFGNSKVTDVARDGSITFTFEEDDDVDAQLLSSQLLGSL